jgi:hypothetical protein
MLVAAVAVIATLAGLGAWDAAAAYGGVHFDPDSPAGKEYALPLERAREEAAGTGTQGESGSSGEGAPLFGAGVSGSGPRSGGAGGGAAGGGSPTAGAESGSGQGGKARAHPNSRPALTNIALAKTGDSFSLAAGVAIIVAILLAAAIVGLVLRRLPSAAAP